MLRQRLAIKACWGVVCVLAAVGCGGDKKRDGTNDKGTGGDLSASGGADGGSGAGTVSAGGNAGSVGANGGQGAASGASGQGATAGTGAAGMNNDPCATTSQGAFEDPVGYTVGNASGPLLAVDLDADGHVDLVAGDGSSKPIRVLMGNADGSFAAAAEYATTE